MTKHQTEEKRYNYIGKADIIAFTSTNHYEPSAVAKYWYGGEEPQMRDKRIKKGEHYKNIPLAIVRSGDVGTKYALGMHQQECELLMESLETFVCDLYSNQRGRYFFCVCQNVEKNHYEPLAREKQCKVFVSYSQADSKYVDEQDKNSLLSYLKALEKKGVRFWLDRRIHAGDIWEEEIKTNIETADVALVLVSHAFLNSKYCTEGEVRRFLQAQKKRGLIILPIVLSACDWESHDWLKAIQYLPRDGKNIESHYRTMGKRKDLYKEILKELRHCCESILKR